MTMLPTAIRLSHVVRYRCRKVVRRMGSFSGCRNVFSFLVCRDAGKTICVKITLVAWAPFASLQGTSQWHARAIARPQGNMPVEDGDGDCPGATCIARQRQLIRSNVHIERMAAIADLER